jgi:hypothetical protein
VQFTNNLLPSGALTGTPGSSSSALMAGGSGRLWWSPADQRGRIELQSDAGDAQILWDSSAATVWDSSSNNVYRFTLPSGSSGSVDSGSSQDTGPTLADIDGFLKQVAEQADVSAANPTSIAGEPAYSVSVSPAHSAGLIGSADLAWDALRGVPLDIAVHAQGQSSPALELKVTDISFGPVSTTDLAVTPPASAKTVDLGTQGGGSGPGSGSDQPVTGLEAVQAHVPFTIVAPDTLVGLPRKSVQLLDGQDKGALVLYGQGLGGIVLVEHATSTDSSGGQSSALPAVDLGASTGHELATALGTVLLFDRSGVSFVLAGSMPPTAAETAARSVAG